MSNTPSRETLLAMLADAYRACKSEAMNCPWCEGYLSRDREEHNPACLWLVIGPEALAEEKP